MKNKTTGIRIVGMATSIAALAGLAMMGPVAMAADGDNANENLNANDAQTQQETVSPEKKALDAAQKDYDAAKAELDSAQKTLDGLKTENETLKKASDDAAASLEKANADVDAKKTALDEAKKNEGKPGSEEEIAAAQKAVDDATAAAKTAHDKADEAKKALDAANTAVTDAQSAYDKAKAAYDAAVNGGGDNGGDNGNTEDQYAKVDGPTTDFFEADDAKGVFTDNKEGWVAQHPDWMKVGQTGDSTSLLQMRDALEGIAQLNQIRKSLGLNELQVNDYLMAIAQKHNQYSTYVEDHAANGSWGNVYNTGENLAWIPGENHTDGWKTSYKMWYDEEKAVWDAAVAKDPSLEQYKNDPYGLSQKDNELYEKVGHYLNIIDPDYKYLGVAVNADLTYTTEFSTAEAPQSKSMDADFYENAFNKFMANRLDKANGKDDGTTETKTVHIGINRTDDPVSNINGLSAGDYTLGLKNAVTDKALKVTVKDKAGTVKYTATIVDGKLVATGADGNTVDTLTLASDDTVSVEHIGAGFEFVGKATDTTTPGGSGEQGGSDTTDVDALKKAMDDTQSKLDDAKKDAEAKQKAYDEANKAAEDADKTVADAQAKLDALKDPEGAVKKAQDEYDAAVKVQTEAKTKAEDAKKAYDDSTAKVTDAQSKVDEATKKVTAAKAALDVAQKAYDDANKQDGSDDGNTNDNGNIDPNGKADGGTNTDNGGYATGGDDTSVNANNNGSTVSQNPVSTDNANNAATVNSASNSTDSSRTPAQTGAAFILPALAALGLTGAGTAGVVVSRRMKGKDSK